MRKTTGAMHRRIGGAIVRLRRELELRQAGLAAALAEHTGGNAPTQAQISRWESGQAAPSPVYRAALGLLAEKHKKWELADVFRAQAVAWSLVAKLEQLELINVPEREQID